MGTATAVVRGKAAHPANPIKEIATKTYGRLLLDDLIVRILIFGIVTAVK